MGSKFNSFDELRLNTEQGQSIKKFLLNLLFPKFCFGCQKEGVYFCQDCRATINILERHLKYSGTYLADLYWSTDYHQPLIKNLIHSFKYKPFMKELSISLSLLIITHLQLIENSHPFFDKGTNFILIPVPLSKKRLKWRGFNQAEELAQELSKILKIPIIRNCLIKIRDTILQVELLEKEREENVLGAFLAKKKNELKGKRVLLIDDIFTTGATMEECAQVLKKAGAKEVIGMVVARG